MIIVIEGIVLCAAFKRTVQGLECEAFHDPD